jgi:hypothetical protein
MNREVLDNGPTFMINDSFTPNYKEEQTWTGHPVSPQSTHFKTFYSI